MTKIACLALTLAACGSGGDDGGGGPDAAPPAHAGGTSVSSLKATNPAAVNTSASAAFDMSSTCMTTNRTGSCYLQSCTSSQQYVSGGTITFTGGTQPVTLSPGANNTYASFTAMSEVFAPEQMVSVSTTGDVAPAYTASLAMPSRLTITAPAKSTSPVDVNRSQDYAISWTGGTVGDVELFASSTATPNSYVICQVPASAGGGSIPSSLLSMFPAGAGSISFIGWSTTQKVSGDWALYFSLFQDTLFPDGSIASLSVTYL